MSINQVITVQNKKYAVGLFWQPMGDTSDANSYALYLSKFLSIAPNFYCDYKTQIGLAFKEYGHKRYMNVGAPEICQTLSDFSSFIAVFHVNEGFWLIAVRNGVILSDQDKLYETESDAKEAYEKLLSLPDWGLKIAPATWKIEHSIEKNIEEVFIGLGRRQLKKIKTKTNIIISTLLISLILLALFFVSKQKIATIISPKPQQINPNQELIQQYKQKIQEETEIPVVKAEKAIIAPYQKLTDLQDFEQSCYKAIAYVMQPISGWTTLDAECNGNNISAKLKKDYGTINELTEQVQNKMSGISITTLSDNDILLSAKLPQIKTVSINPKFSAEEAKNLITSLFDKVNMPITVSLQKQVIDAEDSSKSQTYEYLQLRAGSKIKPEEFIYGLKFLGSVELKSIKWDNKQLKWIYEGVTYVK